MRSFISAQSQHVCTRWIDMIRTKETQLLMLPDEADPKKPCSDTQYTVFFWLLFLLILITALSLTKWSVCCCNG